jgi:hypothetical protein
MTISLYRCEAILFIFSVIYRPIVCISKPLAARTDQNPQDLFIFTLMVRRIEDLRH